MKKYTYTITLIVFILIDIVWLAMHTDTLFSKNEPYLFQFITTRIGFFAIGIYFMRKTKSWLFFATTIAYLLFSFALSSIYYISATNTVL